MTCNSLYYPEKTDTKKLREAKQRLHWLKQWYANRTLDPKDRVIDDFSPRKYIFE